MLRTLYIYYIIKLEPHRMFLAILRIKYQYFFLLCHEIFCNRTNAIFDFPYSLLCIKQIYLTKVSHRSM